MPVLDEHDLRVVLEARDGKWQYKGSNTGKWGIPDHHNDVGGYEDYPEVAINLDEFDTDRDGLPNWWEEEVSGTNPRGVVGDYTDTNTDPDRDGNTHMERYLEFMSTPHFTTQKNKQVEVELSQYALGYTNNPHYSIESINFIALPFPSTNNPSIVSTNGNTLGIKGSTAQFTPAKNFIGVAYFEFKVTDADGDSMVRKIGIRVKE